LPVPKILLNVAVVTPFVVLATPAPMLTPLSRKVTVPPGKATAVVPGLCTLMVAVKMTDCVEEDGLGDELTVVAVPAGPTVWVMAGEMLAA
jgi:hypothetical protein